SPNDCSLIFLGQLVSQTGLAVFSAPAASKSSHDSHIVLQRSPCRNEKSSSPTCFHSSEKGSRKIHPPGQAIGKEGAAQAAIFRGLSQNPTISSARSGSFTRRAASSGDSHLRLRFARSGHLAASFSTSSGKTATSQRQVTPEGICLR